MHFERGANYKQAVKYLQQAAENDIRRFAYREAVALSRRGLELLERLPDTPERARQELWLHVTLGVPLIATEGYAAPDVGSTYTRARELCRQLGETPEISQVLWGLWTFYLVRAELGTAREIAEEFLAPRRTSPVLRTRDGSHLMHLGEFALAMEHFEKASRSMIPTGIAMMLFVTRRTRALRCSAHAAWALWFLGQPDQALDRIKKALALARELSEPHGLAHALSFAAILHQLRREERMAQEATRRRHIAVATEHRLAAVSGASDDCARLGADRAGTT